MLKVKKLNIFKILFILIGLASSNLNAEFLTPEEIEEATTLAKSSIKFEEFTQSSSEEKEKKPTHWLTIEEFRFEYKGTEKSFLMVNSANCASDWGEIAYYPFYSTDKNKINLTAPGKFSDLPRGSEEYRSTLTYEYVPGENPYFILEKVDTNDNYLGNGYSQACVKYFLDEFVSKRTDVTHVFSDCRATAPKYYFPKYGFREGTLQGYTCKRGLLCPYYWIKGEKFEFQPQARKEVKKIKKKAFWLNEDKSEEEGV